MKTTLQIPDDLYREVKTAAAMSGRSITSILEESLRRFLSEMAAPRHMHPLPVSQSKAGFTDEFLATGIDFNDTSEVLAWLDEVEGKQQ